MSAFEDLERELRVILRRAQSSGAWLASQVHPKLDANAFPLLAHVYMNPGTRGSDVASHFGVGRGTVSRQLAKLEDLGLIIRTMDPEDSRGQLVTLTPLGRQRIEQARAARVTALEAALQGWHESDVAMLAHLLARYSASFVAWRQANVLPAQSDFDDMQP